MALKRIPNTSRALARTIRDESVRIWPSSDTDMPVDVEVGKYSTGAYRVVLEYELPAKSDVTILGVEFIKRYFAKRNPHKKVTVTFRDFLLTQTHVELTVAVDIEDW